MFWADRYIIWCFSFIVCSSDTFEGLCSTQGRLKRNSNHRQSQHGSPVTHSLVQGKELCSFVLYLKVDFPPGPSKKTGYRNTHFFLERREMASIVCSSVFSEPRGFPLSCGTSDCLKSVLEVLAQAYPRYGTTKDCWKPFCKAKGSYSDLSSYCRCSLWPNQLMWNLFVFHTSVSV